MHWSRPGVSRGLKQVEASASLRTKKGRGRETGAPNARLFACPESPWRSREQAGWSARPSARHVQSLTVQALSGRPLIHIWRRGFRGKGGHLCPEKG